ncbi:Metallo-beta-lactamase family protein [Fulvivirga imtechensis AK7]|uniref:Metallo-beta-lactamase family protein n=1 Tax=Fulvivirga imtechensis AK7 TaxID=1237149 RepID=L8JS46_9BACT|nr:MBL fold metallo-hydrolase [Fulvivirga imtechensis]ELR71685.1 Metallo-beta-lactamase family protein [Fulvivirga imtechensis AK7]
MARKEINTCTLREWLETGKEVSVLDIRPAHERMEWHIPGSVHVDIYDELKKNNPGAVQSIDLDKSVPVVTVCAGGKTSLIASELLQKAGYEAYSLHGGMKSWSLSWNTASASFEGFNITQFRRTGKGCLSYLIVSGAEAMVVDASLPIEVYQDAMDKRGLTLKYVVDTHIHADHLSRARELAAAYDLQPFVPENDKLRYSFLPVTNGSIFFLEKLEVKAIHAPGHTPESMTYLVNDQVLLTGDTLFTNGVGRPDLKADEDEAKKKARLLYQSLKKLVQLDKSILIMPGHTSQPVAFDGTFIQASLEDILSKVSMLAEEEEAFVRLLMQRIPSPPENYLKIVEKNISGDTSGVDPIELEAGANRCAIS